MSHGFIIGNKSGSGRQMPDRVPNDLYPTPAQATAAIVREEYELFHGTVWEPACGLGHIAEVVRQESPAKEVRASDLQNLGYGGELDFFKAKNEADTIITNPPYSLAQQFIERALEVATRGVIMLARLELLHGQKRHSFWTENPPSRVHVHSASLPYYRDGEWKRGGSFAHAWYVWDSGDGVSGH